MSLNRTQSTSNLQLNNRTTAPSFQSILPMSTKYSSDLILNPHHKETSYSLLLSLHEQELHSDMLPNANASPESSSTFFTSESEDENLCDMPDLNQMQSHHEVLKDEYERLVRDIASAKMTAQALRVIIQQKEDVISNLSRNVISKPLPQVPPPAAPKRQSPWAAPVISTEVAKPSSNRFRFSFRLPNLSRS